MKGFQKRATAVLLAAVMLTGSANTMAAFGQDNAQEAQSISLNPETGMLDIDYRTYLSQHDVVYNSPIENPADGATVGNGRMGGMIWNRNGLTMEVTNVDAAPYTALPSGLVNFYTDPVQAPVDGKFQQRLNLYDGTVTTTYGDGLEVVFMGDPDSELLGIHVKDQRGEATKAFVDLSLWLDKLDADPEGPFGARPYGNPSIPMPNQETWMNPEFHYTEDYVAISRGQEDPNQFGYTLAVSVEGTSYQTAQVGEGTDKKLQLQVEPASEYTIWIANPTRRQAQEHDSKAAAEALLSSASEKGYQKLYERFTGYWHEFWSRSFVQYQSKSNDQMDYMENSWYLYQYLIGCGSRGEFPYHFINGVWRWDERDESMWSWDYTSFNERTFAYTHYATNRLELTDSYYNLFSNNIEGYEKYTHERFYEKDGNQKFAELDGSIMAPERHTWNTERMVGYDGTVNGCPYTTEVNATGPEQAIGLFEKYKFTNDETYLKEKAYPFMKGVCTFIGNFVDVDTDGTYYIKSGHALETYWHQKNPITDLAAFRSILERTIEASEILGVDAQKRAQWQDLYDKLAPFKTAAATKNEGEKYLPHDPPASPLKNSQNPELEIIWPFSRTGIGYADQQTAINTYKERLMPLNIWTPEPIYAARLGLGDDSFANARDMVLRSQTHANGIHDDRNGMFESNALIITGINEELLQGYNDKIRVFPAVVSDPDFSGKFTLLARNGFLVSSEYDDQQVKYVSLVSKFGKQATVCNPWEGEEVTVINQKTGETLLSSSEAEVTFPTETDGIYLVERKNAPISSLTHKTVTGVANQKMKKLIGANGQARVLGNAYTTPITASEVDERSDSILYVGSWTEEVHNGCFNDTGKYSNQKGAYAEFKFIGKSVQIIMPKAQHQGMFNVYLDGELIARNVDSFDKANAKQQLVYAATGFSEGVHKLKIEVTGEKNPDSVGSFITMDKIVVLDSELSLAKKVTLSAEGGEAAIAEPNGTLQLNAELLPQEAASAGLTWKVSELDGSPTQAAQIDQNGLLTALQNSTVLVTATARDGSCTAGSLAVRIRNQNSTMVKWDDRDPKITYSGGWNKWTDSRHYLATETYNATAGDSFSFAFTGTGFGLVVFESVRTGMMNIYIDGNLAQADVDTYNASISGGTPQVLAYQNKDLASGTHQVRVEISSNKNPLSQYPEIKLDAIEIYQEESIDKIALGQLYEQHKNKSPEGYTESSWQVFEAALAEAGRLLEDADATQQQIDEAEIALQQAVDSLIENKTDKSTLKLVIDLAQGHKDAGDVDKLIPTAKEQFNKALDYAKSVYDNPNATQEQADKAWKTLMHVIQALSFVPGDKTELINLVAEAKAIVLSGYEDGAAKDAFVAALKEAEAMIADPDAMKADVDKAYEALEDAMKALVPNPTEGDKSELKKVIDEAEIKNGQMDQYVDDAAAKKAFADALKAATDMYNKEGAKQDEIDKAKLDLLTAMGGLRLRADKSSLNDWLEELKAIDLSQYTAESADVVRAVIARAEALAAQDLGDDEQGLIQAMVAEMENAKAQLEKAPVDPEEPESSENPDSSSKPDGSKPEEGTSSKDNASSDGKEATDKTPTTGDALPVAALSVLAVAAAGAWLLIKRKK